MVERKKKREEERERGSEGDVRKSEGKRWHEKETRGESTSNTGEMPTLARHKQKDSRPWR